MSTPYSKELITDNVLADAVNRYYQGEAKKLIETVLFELKEQGKLTEYPVNYSDCSRLRLQVENYLKHMIKDLAIGRG